MEATTKTFGLADFSPAKRGRFGSSPPEVGNGTSPLEAGERNDWRCSDRRPAHRIKAVSEHVEVAQQKPGTELA